MDTPGLLENLRVVDLSQYIPGPFATRQLADLGAEVIKIEPPEGDPMRQFMHCDRQGLSPVYRHLNRGKRICRLDLKSTRGSETLARLLGEADILLESFRPGVLARLGFDSARLEQINPDLIHCALSGYGQQGPYAMRAGHDINYCALASQSIVSGSAERPVIGFPPIADHSAALQASTAMLAALNARHHGSGGIYIDISITESVLSWQYLPLLTATPARASSILDGGAACYNFYRCADGEFVSLGAIETRFWENFCTALQRTDWSSRQFETMPQQAGIAEVAALLATRPRAHWQALLDPVDCCFEALFRADELMHREQFTARRAIDANGPRHPAWINRRPVDISAEVEEVESGPGLDWSGA